MISINLHLVENFICGPVRGSFPIVVEIVSSECIELAEKIDVREFTLTPLPHTDEDNYFGRLSRGHLGLPGAVFEITPEKARFFVIDLLELWEGTHIPAGRYILKARLDLFRKTLTSFDTVSVETKREVEW